MVNKALNLRIHVFYCVTKTFFSCMHVVSVVRKKCAVGLSSKIISFWDFYCDVVYRRWPIELNVVEYDQINATNNSIQISYTKW